MALNSRRVHQELNFLLEEASKILRWAMGLEGGQILPLVGFLSLGRCMEFQFFTSIGICSQKYI